MIVIKKGADVRGLQSVIWDMLYDIEPFYAEEDLDLVITAALDGKHKEGSFHYLGLAVDIRTRTLKNPRDMFERIQSVLADAFDIILHKTHIHIEYQPKNQKERLHH